MPIRSSKEYRHQARESLMLAAAGVGCVPAFFILYGIGSLIVSLVAPQAGDILLLVVIAGVFLLPLLALFIVAMLIRAGVAFYKARKQESGETG